jgi:hypothetical protein
LLNTSVCPAKWQQYKPGFENGHTASFDALITVAPISAILPLKRAKANDPK